MKNPLKRSDRENKARERFKEFIDKALNEPKGNFSDKEKWLEDWLVTDLHLELQNLVSDILKITNRRMREYANTPLKDRLNAFNELHELEQDIIDKREEFVCEDC